MIIQQVLYVINGTQYLSASLTIRDQRKLHLYNGIMCDSVLNISTVYCIVEYIGGIKHGQFGKLLANHQSLLPHNLWNL